MHHMQETYTPNIPEPNLIFFLKPPQPGKLPPLGSCPGGGYGVLFDRSGHATSVQSKNVCEIDPAFMPTAREKVVGISSGRGVENWSGSKRPLF